MRSFVFLVEMDLDVPDNFIKENLFLLNESLIALFIENRLEKHKNMFFLLFSQISNIIPESCFLLLSHRFAVFHSKVGSQILLERYSGDPPLIQTLDFPLRL